jgi:hypothetical protein
MIKQEIRTIGSHRYRITQLGSSQGLKLLVRLFRALGPAIGAALKGMGDQSVKASKALADLPVSVIGDSVTTLAAYLTEDELENLANLMADHTELHKGGDKWIPLAQEKEIHFAGHYASLLKWLWACLGVNYSDFFDGPLTINALLSRAQQTNPLQSQNGSSGQSGE